MGKDPGADEALRLLPNPDLPSGPGMRSLFRGHAPAPPWRHTRIPRWFGADRVLVATALVVMSGPGSGGGQRGVFRGGGGGAGGESGADRPLHRRYQGSLIGLVPRGSNNFRGGSVCYQMLCAGQED